MSFNGQKTIHVTMITKDGNRRSITFIKKNKIKMFEKNPDVTRIGVLFFKCLLQLKMRMSKQPSHLSGNITSLSK